MNVSLYSVRIKCQFSIYNFYGMTCHELFQMLCYNYTPPFNEVEKVYNGITLSVCPSVERIVSALYLQQYSWDPFYICTSYQATSEGVLRIMLVLKFENFKFWQICQICNFDFVFFWLGIRYDSMVWVIMRRQGVSSEHRRSKCSSKQLLQCNMYYIYTGVLFHVSLLWMDKNSSLLYSTMQFEI